MTHMAKIKYRHAADVHANVTRFYGSKFFNRSGQRVVNAQAHEILYFSCKGAKRGRSPLVVAMADQNTGLRYNLPQYKAQISR